MPGTPPPAPPTHLPPSGPQSAITTAWAPYPEADLGAWAPLIDRLEISHITAIEHTCAPAWRIAPRTIADDMFFHLLAGRGTMTVDGRRTRIQAGDLVHWRRGIVHAAEHDPGQPITVVALHYTATVEGTAHLHELLGFPDRFPLGQGHPLETVSRDAAREYALRPIGWRRGLEATLARLLLTLARERSDQLRPAADAARLADLRRILPGVQAMRETLANPLSVPALARRCGLSEAQFRRVFRGALGCSPVSHLRRLRLAEACRLLRHGDATIERIAGMVGYSETAYFANAFREAMGMPPGRYRALAAL